MSKNLKNNIKVTLLILFINLLKNIDRNDHEFHDKILVTMSKKEFGVKEDVKYYDIFLIKRSAELIPSHNFRRTRLKIA